MTILVTHSSPGLDDLSSFSEECSIGFIVQTIREMKNVGLIYTQDNDLRLPLILEALNPSERRLGKLRVLPDEMTDSQLDRVKEALNPSERRLGKLRVLPDEMTDSQLPVVFGLLQFLPKGVRYVKEHGYTRYIGVSPHFRNLQPDEPVPFYDIKRIHSCAPEFVEVESCQD